MTQIVLQDVTHRSAELVLKAFAEILWRSDRIVKEKDNSSDGEKPICEQVLTLVSCWAVKPQRPAGCQGLSKMRCKKKKELVLSGH